MKWVCELDNAGVLTGYTEMEDADVPQDAVAFDTQPDLEPGKYRWNGEQFDPVKLGQAWFTPDGPDAWYAMFRLCVYLHKNVPNVNLPPPVIAWMKYYYKSFKRANDPNPEA